MYHIKTLTEQFNELGVPMKENIKPMATYRNIFARIFHRLRVSHHRRLEAFAKRYRWS